MNDYYVYVYIDPRSYQEFYFGKGRGSRKDAHLSENSDSEKSKQIKSIQKEGLEPIVRVIARNLSEHDALLVEKTLDLTVLFIENSQALIIGMGCITTILVNARLDVGLTIRLMDSSLPVVVLSGENKY